MKKISKKRKNKDNYSQYQSYIPPFIEDLEQTILRLHVDSIRINSENKGFFKIRKIIEKKGESTINQEDKIMLSIWGDRYQYYFGKMMAYIYCLQEMEYKTVPNLISRLRGWEEIKRDGEVIGIRDTKLAISKKI